MCKVQIRPDAHAALREIIQVNFSVQIVVIPPGVIVPEKSPVLRAVAGGEIQIVRMWPDVPAVIWKVKHRDGLDINDRVPELDIFAGHNPDMAGLHPESRVEDVIGCDERMAGVVNRVGRITLQRPARREDRRHARAELIALHHVRLHVVGDVFTHPQLAAGFNAHHAIGHHVAGILVQRRRVRRQHRWSVFDINAIGTRGVAALK